jgi:beta-lactamase regulating signal transducer with metallopeptidase domain
MSPALLQHTLASAFNWTWKTSLEATVLISLVLLVQFAFAKVLSPRWRYGLGLLILLRLVLPAAPASPLSIFNLGNHRSEQAEIAAPSTTIRTVAPAFFSTAPALADSEPMPVQPVSPPHVGKINVREIAAWLWLAGFAVMLARVAWQQRHFVRRLGRWEPVSEPRVLELVERCRAQLGVRRNIAVLAATGLHTPALFGIARPRLLLPVETADHLDERELRHVLLHELIHLQRGDLLVNWVMILLRAAHWFNPAVWFAFRRLRTEQELACDAAVMARLAADERRDYGRTLLKLLDAFSPGALCPGYVPFMTSKQIIKRRITMISNFKPAGRLAAGASIVLLIALGSMTFTRAADQTNAAADDTSSTAADQARPAGADQTNASMDQAKPSIFRSSDGSLVITVNKDGLVSFGTNMQMNVPVSVAIGKDHTIHVQANGISVNTPGAGLDLNAAEARGLAQALAQLQSQQQHVRAQAIELQAAAQQTYGQTLSAQPDASAPQTFTTDKLTVATGNQADRAVELAAENIRLTEAKLNDLRNLKETYASDAAEHSADQRELTSKLNDMLVEAETQRASKAALLQQLEKMNRAEQRQALPTTVPDAILNKLMQDELAAEDKLAEQTQTMGSSNPDVQATRKMIEKLNLQIDERVKGILNGLRAQVQAADDTIQNLQNEINAKSQRQIELTDLASQIANTESELRDLKSQLSGLQDYQKGSVMVTPSDSAPPK